MKKFLLTIVAATFLLAAKAQSNDVKIDEPTTSNDYSKDKIFTAVEKAPEFVGGLNGFYSYLAHTIRYPADARDHNTQGRVIVTMVVEKDGSLSDIKIVRSVSASIDQEALRAISASPKWSPGMQNGKAVRCQYTVPIAFALGK